MPGARASIGSHLVRPRTPPQMLNARNMSNQRGQPQGDRPGVQREEVKSNERSQPESSSASRPTPSPLNTQQSSPLARTGPPPLPARPPVTPTTPSTSSFSSFFSSKAKSSVSYLASNSKPYRSALAQAGSYVASQAGLIPDRSVRGNAEGNDKEKSWGEWARDWRDRRAQEGKAEESLNLLPGWVVLRPRADYDKTKMTGNTGESSYLSLLNRVCKPPIYGADRNRQTVGFMHVQMMTSNRSTSRSRRRVSPTRYGVRRMPVEVNGCL
jgi:hypothetical protein